jgi:hypothetical protein
MIVFLSISQCVRVCVCVCVCVYAHMFIAPGWGTKIRKDTLKRVAGHVFINCDISPPNPHNSVQTDILFCSRRVQ